MLYDRAKLLDTVASLVGLAIGEDRHVKRGHRSDPPVVVVGGGRGMGKTAALQTIGRAYGNRVPRALLDLASRRYSAEHGDPNSGSSPLLRILQDLQWELEMKVRRNGRLQFPRLSLALLAIATWQPDEEITLAQASKRLGEAGDSVARIARIGSADRGDWVNDWVSDVVAELAAHIVPFPVDVFVRATVRGFTAKALNAGARNAALAWHEEFDPALPGDGYEALIAVSRDFHLGGDFRARAEGTLVAAFLADVRAEYRGLARLGRVGFPVVLLDNVHAHPAGSWLLELVLGRRAWPQADPLVIVATGPPDLAARLAALVPADRPARPDGLLASVELTALDRPVVLRMLSGAHPRRLPPDLAHLIHRLTGGLPLGLDVITRAVAGAAPAGGPQAAGPPLAGEAILALPAVRAEQESAASVAGRLLQRLVPDPDWRSRLCILAAARDFDEAQALVAAHLNTDRDRLAAVQAGQLLRENGWEAGPPDPVHFIREPFLRTLLLDQLRARTVAPTSTDVHTTLRDRYPDGGSGLLAAAEPARLYHCLALGDAAHVARRLSESFAGSAAAAWLAALRTVACAPHGGPADGRREVALGLADDAGHTETHRAVNRLLHAIWFLADPLVAPDQAVADRVAGELSFLAQLHRGGNGVLIEAGVSWRTQLLSWQPTGEYPVRGE